MIIQAAELKRDGMQWVLCFGQHDRDRLRRKPKKSSQEERDGDQTIGAVTLEQISTQDESYGFFFYFKMRGVMFTLSDSNPTNMNE